MEEIFGFAILATIFGSWYYCYLTYCVWHIRKRDLATLQKLRLLSGWWVLHSDYLNSESEVLLKRGRITLFLVIISSIVAIFIATLSAKI
jgi:hypothetical protein